MSGKWKKVIWMICMVELCVIHGAYMANLLIHHRIKWVVIFAFGTLMMSIFQYVSYRRFITECVQELTMLEDEKIREVFCKVNKQVGNAENINNRIYANPQIRIPFVMGFLKQSVIIPETCVEAENLFFVLLHECYHIKRRDTLYKYVMLACNCFLWFHPLAYFLRYISYRDIEISCDEAVVMGKSKEERYRYGKFLLESARLQREKGKAYSAYWNDSKAILKCRIQAVMEEKRNWDCLARIAIVFLLVEVLGLAVWFVKDLQNEYKEINKPVNEFEGVSAPPMYTDAAIEKMLELQPVPRDTYSFDFFSQYDELYPEKAFEDIEFKTTNPWQYVLKRPANFKDALGIAVQRFWFYMENQEAFSSEYYERNPGYATYETVFSDLIAGDINDAVWGIIWKTYATDYTQLNSFQKGYAHVLESDAEYVYFTMAVHVKMVEPYVFRVEGFADLEQTLEAYQAKYLEADYSDFPQLESGEQVEAIYTVVSQDEKLYLQADTGEEIEIPVEKEWFKDPGDPLTGAANGIRKECYQCDSNKIIFVYGQDGQGVKASIYENGEWYKISVTNEYPYGLSKIYVDFPGNKEVGYIYGVVERVAFQEACVLYKTTDGGNTWEKVDMSENAAQHSLTMDFDFLTEQNGYLAIHSSYGNAPQLLRTEDGGITWEQVTFDKVPEYYCQAYAPEIQDEKLVLYVGMEEYSEMKGEKAYYESTDDGRSWNYKKQVIRQ